MRFSILAGLVTGVGLLAGGAGIWFSKTQRIEKLIERKLDCRCTIGSVDFKLGSPTQVTFSDLKIYPKDGSELALASVPSGVLSVTNLMTSAPVLEDITLASPVINLVVGANGPNWLLGKRPGTAGEIASGEGDPSVPHTEAPNDGLKRLRSITLTGGTVNYHNSEKQVFASLQDVSVVSQDASMGQFRIEGLMTVAQTLAGPAFVSVPHAADLTFAIRPGEPDVKVSLTVGEGASVSRDLPVLQKAFGVVDKLRDFGIKLGGIPDRLALKADRVIDVEISQGEVVVRSPVDLLTKGGWGVSVQEGATMNTKTTEHQLQLSVGADPERTEKLTRGLTGVIDKLPGAARGIVRGKLDSVLFRNGRLAIDLTSSGPISKPKVRMTKGMPNLKEMLRGGVDDVLKGLFGRR